MRRETNLGWEGQEGIGERMRVGGDRQSWSDHRVKGGFAFRMRVMTAHLSAEGNDLWRKAVGYAEKRRMIGGKVRRKRRDWNLVNKKRGLAGNQWRPFIGRKEGSD